MSVNSIGSLLGQNYGISTNNTNYGDYTTGAVFSTEVTQDGDTFSSSYDSKIDNLIKLQEEYANENIYPLEDEISELMDEIEDEIKKAIKKQEEAGKKFEEDSKKALEDNLKAYKDANKVGGKGMTKEELQENIKASLPNEADLVEAFSILEDATDKFNQVEDLFTEMQGHVQQLENYDAQIAFYTSAKEAEEEQKANQQACCPCPDPIGFVMGEGEDQAQYEFIVDDGAFDSTNDFLGATDQWAAMQALDSDGDKVVTSEELKAGNIKAVKTDALGNHSVVDITEEFGEDFSVDLNSFKAGGSHSAIDTTADADGNGVLDQTLLGTFNLNVNGQTIQGYDTIDDEEFLNAKYDLPSADTEEIESSNPFISESTIEAKGILSSLESRKDILEENLKAAYEKFGFAEEEYEAIKESLISKSDDEADGIYDSLDPEDKKRIDAEEEGETEVNTEEEKEEKEKEEEELAA